MAGERYESVDVKCTSCGSTDTYQDPKSDRLYCDNCDEHFSGSGRDGPSDDSDGGSSGSMSDPDVRTLDDR
jgi:hypothetical protein